MFVSRLAASGLLLLALLALSLDGKPVHQSKPGRSPPISPLSAQQWMPEGRPPHPIPPLSVQQWSQGRPRSEVPPVVVQPHESPAGGTTAFREELSPGPEAASGPAAPHRLPKSKGASATSAASRPMRDLRTDGKQERQKWGRMVQPDHHAAPGGGGGGGGGARRMKGLAKKAMGKGCFGHKLDRIGSTSGLGC
uniref:Bradykinin-potentiating and C-type natriuretic peptides n=2 Tax=Protobothrops flavoviridis TaxID=88087 RepID=BNP_PROFL|nr:RecName: Full=Bradykinin-potentiating and C-type natriuretic peptides; AltName: Full=BPP-CNP; Contains: RecName: Full=Bradykinin-potentiating peptide Tf1; Contains: RecName: Full=Bradykinin-potentiating peptide Tf2; Contains: RecName: Full=Bradykinin-potentiating peptide Tf3; Contains: RecName: Full=C-type natriuretic peptide Tf-CNP; Contains: RecName: Full=C-type natriuretic peptide Tf-CNP(3-22); Contains: RecName: Full=C-type natriuretic peptide Tf-CNP(6-22); Flags: Precursor [Protobothrops fl